MGVMSKSNRLPERPKPPSWTQVIEDVTAAPEKDVAFQFGQESLEVMDQVSATSLQEKTTNPSSTTSEGSNTAQDTADIDTEKVKASNADVQKLLALYAELTDSVDTLQDRGDRVKLLGSELSHSAAELKVLAEKISAEVLEKVEIPASEKSSSRGKQKQKKKK